MHDFAYYIRTRGVVVFEAQLSGTLHVDQDGLAEMPAQELIHWTAGVVDKFLIEVPPSDSASISGK